ncbi:MAG: DUF2141 domain-containing protein [Sphingomonadales bacterium]|jgi:uncharacterized protein (DUF2141 family)|nr:DUF2141 domain-containing protein [Sphingomonadales bacterium]
MLKFSGLALAALSVLAAPVAIADAAILGPEAPRCQSGAGPALLVRVTGLKSRAGTIRVRTFAGNNPKSWFDKKARLARVVVPVTSSGPVDVCVGVPRAGGYVIDIRHDINANDDTDKADGAGVSGNPSVSFLDFMLGRKPPAEKVVINVGQGVTTVPIVVKYLQGGSFRAVGA